MAVVKKVNDSIRVKILDAMTKKRSVGPNIRQIKKESGFHRATIKSSIDFLEKKGLITGYRPLLDPKVAGYDLFSNTYLQVDPSQKEKYQQLIDVVKKDDSAISFSEVISDSNFNLAISYLSKNIEEHHNIIKKKYVASIPNYYEFIKKRSSFYLSSPIYKRKNEIDTTIDLLKQEQAMD